jgi:hypothetical protein
VSGISRRRLVTGLAIVLAGAGLAGPSAAAAGSAPTRAYQIPNLTDVIGQIRAYYDGPDADHAGADADGAWGKEVALVVGAGLSHLQAAVRGGVSRPAIVLDIDDTCLETESTYRSDQGFAYDGPVWYTYAYARKTFPAIRPTLRLATWAHSHGVEVFYVTGRRAMSVRAANGVTYDIRRQTLADLAAKGFPIDSAHLFLRPASDRRHSVVPFKSGTRREIQRRGFHIVVNAGDQWSDLEGGYADKTVKLPNPMYRLP